jgi:hypothetical protein
MVTTPTTAKGLDLNALPSFVFFSDETFFNFPFALLVFSPTRTLPPFF